MRVRHPSASLRAQHRDSIGFRERRESGLDVIRPRLSLPLVSTQPSTILRILLPPDRLEAFPHLYVRRGRSSVFVTLCKHIFNYRLTAENSVVSSSAFSITTLMSLVRLNHLHLRSPIITPSPEVRDVSPISDGTPRKSHTSCGRSKLVLKITIARVIVDGFILAVFTVTTCPTLSQAVCFRQIATLVGQSGAESNQFLDPPPHVSSMPLICFLSWGSTPRPNGYHDTDHVKHSCTSATGPPHLFVSLTSFAPLCVQSAGNPPS